MVNCPSRYGLLLALSVALLAPTARAQAPQRERIALHPCVITGSDKSGAKKSTGKKGATDKLSATAELEAICSTSAVRETMNLVPSTDVRAFLDKEAHGSCAKVKNRNACLGHLASATQATRTLYITLDPFNLKVTHITGLVVDEAGKKVEERPLDLPRLPQQPAGDVVRFAVSQMLNRLDVAKAPPLEMLPGSGAQPEPELPPMTAQTPPTTPPPTAATPAPSAPIATVKQEAPPGRTWKTPVGRTALAVGGAGIIASGVLVLLSNSDAKKFNDAFDGKLPANTDLERLQALQGSVQSKRKLAAISASAGAALAIGGAILWLTDGPSRQKSSPGKAGTARLLAGPGQVGVLVLLP